MIHRRKFLAGAAATALIGISATTTAAETSRNVSYGANRLDIYSPGTTNAPVIIYVHGGAWRAGSKGSVGSMPSHYNKKGYVFVSVGYSLSGNADRQSSEVAQAINWVRANIAKYGGNPGRIGVMGHSAGCHLACLAVLSGRAGGVRALGAVDTGAYDIAYLAEINGGRLPVLYAALNNRAQWRNWSPISYAGGGGGLPVLVAWSGGRNRDRISKRFADRLAASGHPVTRYAGTQYSHIGIRNAMGRPGGITSALDNFFAARL